MVRPSASTWGQLSIWNAWASSPKCVRDGVDAAHRAVACDQFFNNAAHHMDWAAQAAVYYDAAARHMKVAEGVERDPEIKMELTKGAAECLRRAKELRDAMAPALGCSCAACKKQAPKKEAPKKEAPKVSPLTHYHCVVCAPGPKKGGCGCPKCQPACPVHVKCACQAPPKGGPKTAAPKKETPKPPAPKKETPKPPAPKKETPKPAAPPFMPVCVPWMAVPFYYTPCVPMVYCVPKQ